MERIRNLIIPKPLGPIQTAIGLKLAKAARLTHLAFHAKSAAIDLLNQHVQFQELDRSVKDPTWGYIGSQHGRLDAEYYQPKYLRLDEYLNSLPSAVVRVDSLGDLIEDGGYGVLPPSETYGTGELPFLRAQEVGEFLVDYGNPIRVPARYENPKAMTMTGDILLEVKGAIQGAAVCPREAAGFLVNGSIYRAAVKDEIDAHYLVAVLTSPLGRLQKQRAAANSIISYLSADFLNALLVPRISEEVEETIGSLLKQFCERSNEAEMLIAQSKQDVEDLISGTLDKSATIRQGDIIAGWIDANSLPDRGEGASR